MAKTIWIAPFSGGAFLAQLSLMIIALQNGLKPDICMGCSGGNFSCYLCFANNFNPQKIQEKIYSLSDKIVVAKWANGYFGLIGQVMNAISSGALFSRPKESFLDHEYKNVEWCANVEMWTLTFNASVNKTQPWCNKRQDQAFVKSVNKNSFSLDPKFVSGDYDLIKSIIMASAAVNVTQPPVEILGQTHVDGGFQYPSPFIPLSNGILNIANTEIVKLVYFNAVNLNCGTCSPASVFENVSWSLENLMNGHIVLEIEHILLFFKSLLGRVPHKKSVNSANLLSCVKEKWSQDQHCLIVFYPLFSVEIDYTNFQSNNIDKIVKLVSQSCKIDIYD